MFVSFRAILVYAGHVPNTIYVLAEHIVDCTVVRIVVVVEHTAVADFVVAAAGNTVLTAPMFVAVVVDVAVRAMLRVEPSIVKLPEQLVAALVAMLVAPIDYILVPLKGAKLVVELERPNQTRNHLYYLVCYRTCYFVQI